MITSNITTTTATAPPRLVCLGTVLLVREIVAGMARVAYLIDSAEYDIAESYSVDALPAYGWRWAE